MAIGRSCRLDGESSSGMVEASYWETREREMLRWVGILT